MSSSDKNIIETSGNSPQIPRDIAIGDFVVAKFKLEDLVDSPRSQVYFSWKKE